MPFFGFETTTNILSSTSSHYLFVRMNHTILATGLHCYASDNFCFTSPPCTVTDGTTSNTGPCICGNIACTAVSGLHCLPGINQCSIDNNFIMNGVTLPVCVHTDNSILNAGDCICGNTACTVKTGMLCNADANTCSRVDDKCAAIDGMSINIAACGCGSVDCLRVSVPFPGGRCCHSST